MRDMNRRNGERGGALLLAIIVAIVLIGITAAYISVSLWNSRRTTNSLFGTQALYIAEAGAGDYVQMLNTQPPIAVPSSLSKGYGRGTYKVTSVNYGADGVDNDKFNGVDDAYESGFMELQVEGTFGDVTRRLNVILTRNPGGVFWNAVFAGNSAGKNYTLKFSGTGTQGDRVQGDVYSGGKLEHSGDANLLNTDGTAGSDQVMYASTDSDALTATSSQGSKPAYVQGNQPLLDITSMDYESKAKTDPKYVDVRSALETKGNPSAPGNSYGNGFVKDNKFSGNPASHNGTCGKAQQQITDPNEPAHIFRLNPDDDANPANGDRAYRFMGDKQTKNPRNYHLEDATMPPAQGEKYSEVNPQWVKLAPTGNDKVYYVDGNLWINNSPTFTFKWAHSDPAMKITIIVKGNIYICDNLYYQNEMSDAVALIAIKDDVNLPNKHPDDPMFNGAADREKAARDYNMQNGSGNIFFGDPIAGTTERFETYLYAENNFYDNNLGAADSMATNILGNMTAGNQVAIQRDPKKYSKLQVVFDDKIRTGKAVPPGLPSNPSSSATDWLVASWKQVP
jgi:hypothetical protein